MNTEARQTNGSGSRSAPDVEGAEWVVSGRPGQKFLQVRKSQVFAQAALGSLEIRGVSARIVFEAVSSLNSSLHATLTRTRQNQGIEENRCS